MDIVVFPFLPIAQANHQIPITVVPRIQHTANDSRASTFVADHSPFNAFYSAEIANLI
jgi:hypothetical protein